MNPALISNITYELTVSDCDTQDKRQYIKTPTISILTNIMFNISKQMWLHHQNKYRFGTGANYKQCCHAPSLKMQNSHHL